MEGWIKLHRKILDNDLWVTDNHLAKVIFIDCVLKANHKARFVPIKGSFGIHIKRGEFITSLRKMANYYNSTTKTIKKILVLLQKMGILETQGKTHYTLIIVRNYDQYQHNDNVNGNTLYDTEVDTTETVRTTQGKRTLPTNKKVKNDKNEKNSIYTSSFEKFWNVYPVKVGKKIAFGIWKRQHIGEVVEEIVEFVDKAKGTRQWKEGFIPHPTTFLNGHRWEDDLSAYGKQREVVSVK